MTGTCDYPACVADLYQSEVFGEAVFLSLVEAAKNPRERYHFATFLQLETETKARLRPLLFKYDFPFEEQAHTLRAEQIVEAYRAAPWRDFLAGIKPTIESYVQRFMEISALGPEQDKAVLESMIAHEQSFLHWIDRELADATDSLDAVLDIVQYPLQPTLQIQADR